MSKLTLTKTIHAPVELVFETISDVEHFAEAVPEITEIEFLSDSRKGMGTRFRETRLINGKEVIEEMQVVEYEENKRITFKAESYGTEWYSQFEMAGNSLDTEFKLTMESNAHTLMAKVMNFIMKRMFRKSLENDMEAVKFYCEAYARKQ